MAPGAKIRYYGVGELLRRRLPRHARAGSSTRTRRSSSPTRGATLERGRRAATTIAAYEQVFLQGALRASAFMFSSGDNGDERREHRHQAGRLPGLRPVRHRRRRHVHRDRRDRRDCRARPAGAPRSTPSRPTASVVEPGRLPVRRRRRRRPALFNQPAYQDGHHAGRCPAASRRRDGRRPDHRHARSVRPRPSRTASYYDEYRIGGTSLASPLFAGHDRAGPAARRSAAWACSTRRSTPTPAGAFTDVTGTPADAGQRARRLRQRPRRLGRASLLRPDVRPGLRACDVDQGLGRRHRRRHVRTPAG